MGISQASTSFLTFKFEVAIDELIFPTTERPFVMTYDFVPSARDVLLELIYWKEKKEWNQGDELDHLGFVVPDMDEAMKWFRKNKVEITKEPHTLWGKSIKVAFIADPNGIWSEIVEGR